jgi:hypothetical protein
MAVEGGADLLEQHAAVRRNDIVEQREVAADGGGHPGAVPLPSRGAALNIGDQKLHRLARQVRHAATLR